MSHESEPIEFARVLMLGLRLGWVLELAQVLISNVQPVSLCPFANAIDRPYSQKQYARNLILPMPVVFDRATARLFASVSANMFPQNRNIDARLDSYGLQRQAP